MMIDIALAVRLTTLSPYLRCITNINQCETVSILWQATSW